MREKKFLSNNKIIIIILIIASLLLASCGSDETVAADLVQTSTRVKGNYRTVECVIGDVERFFTAQAYMDYDVEYVLFTGEDTGTLKEMHVYNRMVVTKGDLLAEIDLDNVAFTDEYEKLRLNVENAEIFLALEKESRQENIADLAAQLPDIGPREAGLMRIRIEKAKLEFELYVYETELRINKWKEEMRVIEEKLKGIKIYAPVSGFTIGITTIGAGREVTPGTLLMQIYYNENIRLTLNADSSNFRYNMDLEVEVANDEVYTGRVISDPTSYNQDGGSMDFKIEITNPPDDLRAFQNLLSNRRIFATGKTTDVTGVPTLPYHSLINENGLRYVMLLEDNIVKKRYVQVGLFNFQSSEIVSGVKPGEFVLE